MSDISKSYFDLGYMDTLANKDNFLTRLDPRAKLITSLIFILTVVSFKKYTLLAFIPFFIYPISVIAIARIPLGYILKKVLLVAPFALLVGIFNPLVDKQIFLYIGSIGISGGWISFLSILIRFFLTVLTAMLLVAVTGFNNICEALLQLGVPRPFVTQLMFFYRYLFVLTDEAQRMERARALRSFKTGALPYNIFISFMGQLLLRTLDRAERIYRAMCCRGFNGHVPKVRTIKSSWRDYVFVLGWSSVFMTFRSFNLPLILGDFFKGLFL